MVSGMNMVDEEKCQCLREPPRCYSTPFEVSLSNTLAVTLTDCIANELGNTLSGGGEGALKNFLGLFNGNGYVNGDGNGYGDVNGNDHRYNNDNGDHNGDDNGHNDADDDRDYNENGAEEDIDEFDSDKGEVKIEEEIVKGRGMSMSKGQSKGVTACRTKVTSTDRKGMSMGRGSSANKSLNTGKGLSMGKDSSAGRGSDE
ncbi:hypothetical protein C0995_004931 [Termitomyces sp. Mi166|nr:hypothetical protein C0995_004931 [Termitomyces sp. Mi166\